MEGGEQAECEGGMREAGESEHRETAAQAGRATLPGGRGQQYHTSREA